MKNQSINTASANGKVDFLNIKTAKNPIYQPMAAKTVVNPEGKKELTEGTKNEEIITEAKTENVTASDAPKSLGAVVLPQVVNERPGNSTEIIDKPALNLEGTLKLVEELHRRMVQRGRLVFTIDNLDKFEIEQKEEAEDTTSNYYQGCELEITDDKRNQFSTKNPVIIKAVALFVRKLCTDRLAEIEAEITIPA